MASTASADAKPLPSSFHMLTPAQLARLQPHTYVYSHLNPPPDNSRAPVRANGRTQAQFRPATVNTGSLTHANGSAVVRIGETTAVCGVRGEILSTNDIPAWKVSKGASSAAERAQKRTKEDGVPDEEDEDDDSEISSFNLLVPNLSLSTGCSPSILAGSPPSSLAQSLSHQLLSLLHTSRLIRANNLRIWSNPPAQTQAPSQEHTEDISMENNSEPNDSPVAPEIKAFWTLYIDVLIISHAGNPFDAAWAAVIAALRDTRLPKAWWDMDSEMVLCSDRVAESRRLHLRGMPISSSFAVFEADPIGDWRKIIVSSDAKETKGQDEILTENGAMAEQKRWVLADPDAFEESLCQERICFVVDDAKTLDRMKILRLEKTGGFYIGKAELRELANLASQRWEEWRNLLEGLE